MKVCIGVRDSLGSAYYSRVTHAQTVSLKLRDLGDRMNRDNKNLNKAMARALSGKGAHTEPGSVFAGLDWKVVSLRPDHVAHSLFQLLNHMVFWQDWVISWLDGTKPPTASGSWRSSQGPASRDEWERAVRRFRTGLDNLASRSREADLFSTRGRTSQLDMLQTVASHNSYHTGQVVLLRRILGAWPPETSGRGR